MAGATRFQPVPVRVYQADDRVMLAAPMPGLEADDIDVRIDGPRVTITGGTRRPRHVEREVVSAEWTIGPYRRDVVLPHPVDGTLANATYHNGVLVLVMPKADTPAERPAREFHLERADHPPSGERIGHQGSALHPTTTEAHRRSRGATVATHTETIEELPHGVLMAHHVAMERWVHVAVMLLGGWLLFTPVTLTSGSAPLVWSDVITGLLVIAFSALALQGRIWAPWANVAVGAWVAFAPLAFWAPTPVEYANDTLVGALVVAFSVIIPMRTEMPGPDVPPGWTYNPSTWAQRAPAIALAAVSFFLARWMAAFQLGHIPGVWDPIFGDGTERVLTSDVSRAFPVSDSGLGAYTYLVELLSAVMGDRRRWRTMPWMVAMFGVAVVPLGIVSVVLVMLQPVAVGAWCTMCLITALFMLVMVALSLDEIVAMIQFLVLGRRAGRSAWRLFWTGGTLPERMAGGGHTGPARPAWIEMFWGAGVSWPLLASALVGGWVMAAPWLFGTSKPALSFESVAGALAIVVAFVAWAEVTRTARLLNVVVGLVLAVGTWFLADLSSASRMSDTLAGILLAALSVPRGPVREHYGSWDAWIV